MGNLCISGNSATTLDESGGGSATPNTQQPASLSSPPPPRPEAAGDPAQSTQSPLESANPQGIAPTTSSPAGTPRRRRSRWSPSSMLLRRPGEAAAASTSQSPIPDGSEGGRRGFDINFGYTKDFSSLFKLGKIVGRGHFGHTCKARGLRGEFKNKHVAVKIISKAKMTTPLEIADVRREVNILRALSGHQNLIQFYEAFEDEDYVFIVMEYCEGGELLNRIFSRSGGYQEEEDAKRVVVQILNVVAHIHLQGVVHRDLKPENFLFIDKKDDAPIKVIDFGLSSFIKPEECLNDVVGSAYYIAPEVHRRSYNVNADMWSVGVLTYVILSGTRPFSGRNELEIFNSVLHLQPNLQDGPWRNRSMEAKDFVRRLLIKDYKKRMTAAQALTHPWLRSQDPVVPLDIWVFKLVKTYARFTPIKRAAILALSMALTEQELVYLKAQFQLLEPTNGYVSIENFRMGLMKNMSEAMRQSNVLDILSRMPHGRMDFLEFCAAAISPLQLEALENWQQMVTTAYTYFEQWNRQLTIEEIAQEVNLGPLVPSIVRQWLRSDGKLTFHGFTKILHENSAFQLFAARRWRLAGRNMATPAASTSTAADTSSGGG